jgi:hypothetical protein
LCSRHYDEDAQREEIECVEIIASVAGCLSESPERSCSLVHHFMKTEDVLKMEQHHQPIIITHSKEKDFKEHS